jgi:membrane protein
MRLGELKSLAVETLNEWVDDKCPNLAAALSYYTVFSLAPLLIIVISIAGLIFDKDAAQGHIVYQIRDLVGQTGAEAIENMLRNASRPEKGVFAAVVGFVVLLIGATGVFVELKDSLNQVWDVPPPSKSGGIFLFIKKRFLSFAMILGIGFLLLVSLILSAVLSAMTAYIGDVFPGLDFLWSLAHFVISLGVITVLFAMMFKFLPDVEMEWHDVSIGAVITAVLFTIGKSVIGLYLGRGTVGSVFGAAGSLAVVLFWVYYSAQIFFFGAEFTQVYARRRGSHSKT